MQDYLSLSCWRLSPLHFGFIQKHHKEKGGLKICKEYEHRHIIVRSSEYIPVSLPALAVLQGMGMLVPDHTD